MPSGKDGVLRDDALGLRFRPGPCWQQHPCSFPHWLLLTATGFLRGAGDRGYEVWNVRQGKRKLRTFIIWNLTHEHRKYQGRKTRHQGWSERAAGAEGPPPQHSRSGQIGPGRELMDTSQGHKAGNVASLSWRGCGSDKLPR